MEDKAQASAEAASVGGKRLSAEAMTGGSGRGVVMGASEEEASVAPGGKR